MSKDQSALQKIADQVKATLGAVLTQEGLRRGGLMLAQMADNAMPGSSSQEKKQWAKTILLSTIETYDNMIPTVGAFMDMPFVDGLQKAAVDIAVERGYALLLVAKQINGPTPIIDDSSLPTGR